MARKCVAFGGEKKENPFKNVILLSHTPGGLESEECQNNCVLENGTEGQNSANSVACSIEATEDR